MVVVVAPVVVVVVGASVVLVWGSVVVVGAVVVVVDEVVGGAVVEAWMVVVVAIVSDGAVASCSVSEDEELQAAAMRATASTVPATRTMLLRRGEAVSDVGGLIGVLIETSRLPEHHRYAAGVDRGTGHRPVCDIGRPPSERRADGLHHSGLSPLDALWLLPDLVLVLDVPL